MQFPSDLFSIRLLSVHVVHPYSSINITTAWKKLRFVLSDSLDFHMIDNLLMPSLGVYIDVSFSRWDAATEVHELVH